MSFQEFRVTGPITAQVKVPTGDIEIIAEERDTVTVSIQANHVKMFGLPADPSREMVENTRVEMVGNTLIVEAPSVHTFGFLARTPSVNVSIRMPLHGTVDAKTGSAGVHLSGHLAGVKVQSASGDVGADVITGDVEIKTASGDVEIDAVGRNASLSTASGDVGIRTIGAALQMHTASGTTRVGSVGGAVKVKSASGDVRLGSLRTGDARIDSASGNVEIGIARGTAAWLDVSSVSGHTTSDLDTSAQPPSGEPARLNLHARTVSGDIHIFRATSAPTAATPDGAAPAGPSADDLAPADVLASGDEAE